VTTGAVYDTVPAATAEQNPAFWERTRELKREAASMARRAWDAGVTMVAGGDGDYVRTPGFTLVSELESLITVGVPPMGAIQAATSRAAECYRLSDRKRRTSARAGGRFNCR
jgi:imidazolonepropionase-like amidohydrolase